MRAQLGIEPARRRWTNEVRAGKNRGHFHAAREASVRAFPEKLRVRHHLSDTRDDLLHEASQIRPRRTSVRGPERDEIGHMPLAVQLLHVVAADQAAL